MIIPIIVKFICNKLQQNFNRWAPLCCALFFSCHYSGVKMASQITRRTIVYSTVCSGADQRKYQSSASLAFALGIHRWPVNSPRKGPVTRKMLPVDDVIMLYQVVWVHVMLQPIIFRVASLAPGVIVWFSDIVFSPRPTKFDESNVNTGYSLRENSSPFEVTIYFCCF